MNFSFAGCGFMGIYHVGVASCLREYVPHLVEQKISGASAGATLACVLLCKCPLGKCTTWTMKIASQTKKKSLGPMHPTVDLSELLEEGLREVLPPNAHEIATGRLHVSLTRVPDKKNVIVSEFKTFDELIQVLLCSAYIPYFSGLVIPSYRGSLYMDGAASDNAPRIDEHTVTVSPFSGTSDICPRAAGAEETSWMRWERPLLPAVAEELWGFTLSGANVWRLINILYPPGPDRLSDICKQGFSDTLKYLQTHHLIHCPRHLKVKSKVVKVHRTKRLDSATSPRRRAQPKQADGVSTTSGDITTKCDDVTTKCDDVIHGAGCDSVDCRVGVKRSCEECDRTLNTAFSLPATVSEALEEAASIVNKGVFGYLKGSRLYKLWSLAISPFYVPVDLYMHFLLRVARWLPRCLTDMRRFMSTLMLCMMWISKQVVDRGKINFKHLFERLVHHELSLGTATFEAKELGGCMASGDSLDVDVPVTVSPSRLCLLQDQVNHLYDHELRCSARSPRPSISVPRNPYKHRKEEDVKEVTECPPLTGTATHNNNKGIDNTIRNDAPTLEEDFFVVDVDAENAAIGKAPSKPRPSFSLEGERNDDNFDDDVSSNDGDYVALPSYEGAVAEDTFGKKSKGGRRLRWGDSVCEGEGGEGCLCGCDVCLEWENPDALTRVSVSDASLAHTVLSYHYQDDDGDIQETKIYTRAVT